MTTKRVASDGEAGVVVVLVALVVTALLIVTAFVIDLGYMRGSARSDQAIADLAALAAGEDLENQRFVEACETMIEYVNRNAHDMPTIDAGDFCGRYGGHGLH